MTVCLFASTMCGIMFIKLLHVDPVYICTCQSTFTQYSIKLQCIISLQVLAVHKTHYMMRNALFWVTTQRVVAIPYRRFGTTFRSQIQGSKFQFTMYVHGKTETEERLGLWSIYR